MAKDASIVFLMEGQDGFDLEVLFKANLPGRQGKDNNFWVTLRNVDDYFYQ